MQTQGPAEPEDTVLRSEVEARQGADKQGVRYVLAFGTAGAAIALGIVTLAYIL